MTRVARLLHLDDGEFPALRAQIEAAPLPKRPARKPLGSGRSAIGYLTAVAPVDGPVRHRSRYTVAALVPAGQLAVVPLPDPAETVIAEVRAAMAELAPFAAKAGA